MTKIEEIMNEWIKWNNERNFRSHRVCTDTTKIEYRYQTTMKETE